MRWWKLQCREAKWHYVPDELLEGIFDSLEAREIHVTDFEETTAAYIESMWVGFTLEDRAHSHLDLEGLIIKIPTAEISDLYRLLKGLKEEEKLRHTYYGDPYYKLHGLHSCTCLTPDLSDVMCGVLGAVLEESSAVRNMEDSVMNDRMSEGHPAISYFPRKTDMLDA